MIKLIRTEAEDGAPVNTFVAMGLSGGEIVLEMGASDVREIHVFEHGEDATAQARAACYGEDNALAEKNRGSSADLLTMMLWLSAQEWDRMMDNTAEKIAAEVGADWESSEDVKLRYRNLVRRTLNIFLTQLSGQ